MIFYSQSRLLRVMANRTTRAMVRVPVVVWDHSMDAAKVIFFNCNNVRVRGHQFTWRMRPTYRVIATLNHLIYFVNCNGFSNLCIRLLSGLNCIRFRVRPFLFRFNMGLITITFNRFRPTFACTPIRCQCTCPRYRRLLIRQITMKFFRLFITLHRARLYVWNYFGAPINFYLNGITFALRPTTFRDTSVQIILRDGLRNFICISYRIEGAIIKGRCRICVFKGTRVATRQLSVVISLSLHVRTIYLFNRFIRFRLRRFIFNSHSSVMASLYVPMGHINMYGVVIHSFRQYLYHDRIGGTINHVNYCRFGYFSVNLFYFFMFSQLSATFPFGIVRTRWILFVSCSGQDAFMEQSVINGRVRSFGSNFRWGLSPYGNCVLLSFRTNVS